MFQTAPFFPGLLLLKRDISDINTVLPYSFLCQYIIFYFSFSRIKINGKSYTFDANGVYITAAAANKRK